MALSCSATVPILTGSVKASLSSIVVPDIAFGCTVISSPIFCATACSNPTPVPSVTRSPNKKL